jgi:hypothetical protein
LIKSALLVYTAFANDTHCGVHLGFPLYGYCLAHHKRTAISGRFFTAALKLIIDLSA